MLGLFVDRDTTLICGLSASRSVTTPQHITRTRPVLGCSWPVRILMVLPVPFGSKKSNISPGSIAKLMPDSAANPA